MAERHAEPLNPLIIIPARMAAQRLPGKPLADIAGKPMIVRVCERAVAAGIGPVIVAGGEAEIIAAVRTAGYQAVLTDPDLPSGSDRVFAAARIVDPEGTHNAIINVQGDMPTISPAALRSVLLPLENPRYDIATLAYSTTEHSKHDDPNIVKAILSFTGKQKVARALYFTRAAAPTGAGPYWHHIGIYAYRRAALNRFVSAPAGPLEQRERLEQLRALEIGLAIGCHVLSGTVPVSVDTEKDLHAVRALYESTQNQP